MNFVGKLKNKVIDLFSHVVKPMPFPSGVKIILWYTAILGLFSFLIGFIVPIIYPTIFELNPMIMIFNVFFLAISGFIIYGMIKRQYWAYKLILIWYGVAIVYNFLYFFYSYEIFDVMSEILMLGLIFSFIVNCVVVWYLVSQHDYFKHRGLFLRHRKLRLKLIEANDHVFMVVFISFWFVSLLVLILSGAKLLNDTFTVSDEIMLEVSNVGFFDVSICNTGNKMHDDICYMTYGISLDDGVYCDSIDSPFYKFTCFMGS